jgi:predicted DNA-binding transcriptional regulator AlpA
MSKAIDREKILATLPVNLPDELVLTDIQACAIIGVSEDTLLRLDQRGEGPQKVKLSDRRHGRTMRAIRGWLKARSSEAAA